MQQMQTSSASGGKQTPNGGSTPRRPVPKVKGLPWIGSTPAFIKNPLAMLESAYKEHGEVFSFTLAGSEMVLFASPEAHHAYFAAAEDHLSAKDVYQFTVPIFGRGVAYDSPRHIMDQQLGFLLPALGNKHLRRYVEFMQEEIESYIADWGDEGEIDLPAVTNDLTVHIACRCLLGQEIRDRLYDGFSDLYHDLQLGINTIGFFAPKLPTSRHIKRDRARKRVKSFIGEILQERRNAGRTGDDFMGRLMESQYKDGRTLSDDEITGLLLTVLFGGQHTSCVLAAWAGIELMQHKEYLPVLLDELEQLYGPLGPTWEKPMTLASLKESDAMHRLIMEGERMHPPLILLVRKVMKPFEYNGFRLEEGTMAMVSPGLSHRLPSVFSDPHRFDPERFAKPREEHRQHPMTLIGFGGGKHRCIGMGFAYLQLKAIWTVLLRNFDFELASPAPAPDYSNWVTGPQNPCTVRYVRRTSQNG